MPPSHYQRATSDQTLPPSSRRLPAICNPFGLRKAPAHRQGVSWWPTKPFLPHRRSISLVGHDCPPLKLGKPLSSDPFPTGQSPVAGAPEASRGSTSSGWKHAIPITCRPVTGFKGECRQRSPGRFVETVGRLGVSANLIEAPPGGWTVFPPRYSTKYVVTARA